MTTIDLIVLVGVLYVLGFFMTLDYAVWLSYQYKTSDVVLCSLLTFIFSPLLIVLLVVYLVTILVCAIPLYILDKFPLRKKH